MKKFLTTFEFHCGGYSQVVYNTVEANDLEEAESIFRDYLSNYYGKDNLDSVEGDLYTYHIGEVMAEFCGVREMSGEEIIEAIKI